MGICEYIYGDKIAVGYSFAIKKEFFFGCCATCNTVGVVTIPEDSFMQSASLVGYDRVFMTIVHLVFF